MKQFFDKDNPLSNLLESVKSDMGFRSEDYDKYLGELEGKAIVSSVKIDGELTLAYSDNDDTYLINRLGRVRKDIPVTDEIASLLKSRDKTILVGELYGVDSEGDELSFNDTMSLIRKPESEEDENRIRLGIFDILAFDGKKTEENDYWERMLLIQEMFEKGNYAHPVYAKKSDGTSVVKEMWENNVIQDEHEGVVLYVDGEFIKIKPARNVDALVIAIKPQKEKPLLGSLFVALMDDDGEFRSLSFVGSGKGLTKTVRSEWYSWAIKNKVDAPNKDELIWVNIDTDPRIVEIAYEEESIKETDTFRFSDNKWVQVSDKLSSTLRKPLLVRIRDDKSVNENDLRLSQISGLDKSIKNSFAIKSSITSHEGKPWENKEHIYKFKGIVYEHDILLIYLDCLVDKSTIVDDKENIDRYRDRVINYEEFLAEYNKLFDTKKSFEIKSNLNRTILINAFYPKNPKTVIIDKNEFYHKGVNEEKIWNYYDTLKYKIIPKTKDKNVILLIKSNGEIFKRKNDGLIHIDNTNDFNRLNNGRLVEIHPEFAFQKGESWFTDIIFCDIDPKEKFDWDATKKITKDVYKIFSKDSNIKKVELRFSGNRGFHIIGILNSSWDVNRAREYTKKILKPLETDKIKIGIVKEDDMLRLDTTLIKKRGSLRVPYSLHKSTGLVALPIDIKQLDKFDKRDATIDKVLKGIAKKSFLVRAREFTSEEALHIGNELGIDWNQIDLEQFRLGLEIELEHGAVNTETNITNDDLLMTGKIAWAHIKEVPDYYTLLTNIERKKSFIVGKEKVVLCKKTFKLASILDYPKPGLSPEIWDDDGTIKSEIKDQILGKLYRFIEEQGYTTDFIDAVNIIGSLTSYQYNKFSDLDIHVAVDPSKLIDADKTKSVEDIVEILDKEWRKILNLEQVEDVVGTGHPMEFYFEIPGYTTSSPSDGVYDLLNDKWTKPPRTIDIDYDVSEIYPEVILFADDIIKQFDIQIGSIGRDITDIEFLIETIGSFSEEEKLIFKDKLIKKIEEVNNDILELISVGQDIVDKRHEEYDIESKGNLTFKYLQRYGYIYLFKELQRSIGEDSKFDLDDLEDVKKVISI